MNITTIIMIITIVAAVLMMGTLTYLYLKNSTLDDIRADVYQLILKAEHMYYTSGCGKQKLKWVVNRARSLLPGWLQAFISVDMMTELVQKWFDAVKDLLDDGKYNNSAAEADGYENAEEDDDGESDIEKGN